MFYESKLLKVSVFLTHILYYVPGSKMSFVNDKLNKKII